MEASAQQHRSFGEEEDISGVEQRREANPFHHSDAYESWEAGMKTSGVSIASVRDSDCNCSISNF